MEEPDGKERELFALRRVLQAFHEVHAPREGSAPRAVSKDLVEKVGSLVLRTVQHHPLGTVEGSRITEPDIDLVRVLWRIVRLLPAGQARNAERVDTGPIRDALAQANLVLATREVISPRFVSQRRGSLAAAAKIVADASDRSTSHLLRIERELRPYRDHLLGPHPSVAEAFLRADPELTLGHPLPPRMIHFILRTVCGLQIPDEMSPDDVEEACRDWWDDIYGARRTDERAP